MRCDTDPFTRFNVPTPNSRTVDSRLRTPDFPRAGFTLLEVMVALAVLAIGIVTVLELFAGSLRLGAKASHYTQATIYAQNVMDRLFAQSTLEDGEESGAFPGGYVWHARVQEVPPEEEDERASTGLQGRRQRFLDFFRLKELEVSVSWEERGKQAVVLRSLRTVVVQPIGTQDDAG